MDHLPGHCAPSGLQNPGRPIGVGNDAPARPDAQATGLGNWRRRRQPLQLLGDNCQSSGLYGLVGSGQVRLGDDSGESDLVRWSCGLWNDCENDCETAQRFGDDAGLELVAAGVTLRMTDASAVLHWTCPPGAAGAGPVEAAGLM